jgi:hypothetical protein
MKTVRMMAGVAALAALAGCTSAGPSGGGGGSVVARAPANAVEGAWSTSDGVATTRFTAGGTFDVIANDTGSRLAEGTYRFVGTNDVTLNGFSLIRQQPVTNNCRLVSATQLNCTSAEQITSVLVRRAGV